jgi:hypothetical protein
MYFDSVVSLPVCILPQVYTLMILLSGTTLVSTVYNMDDVSPAYIYTFEHNNYLQGFFL